MLATAGLLLLPATRASADDDDPDWRITNYAVTAQVDADGGVTHVRLDLDFDFGEASGTQG